MKLRLTNFPRLRMALAKTLHHRAARFALAAGVVGMLSLAGYNQRPAPMPSSLLSDITVMRDPRFLSDMDRSLYTAIFSAQERGDYSTADSLMTQLDNQILLGHVLASRYLDDNYPTTADELVMWLQNYNDHPEAARIAQLARRKGADTDGIAGLELASKPLKGDGYVFHLGRSTMPDGWYEGLRLWKEGKFASAATAFNAIGDNEKLNPWQRSAGSYWAYRSLLRQGDRSEANRALANAAQQPMTFYGMLALARQGERMPIHPTAPQVSYSLRNDGHVLRADAFSALGMNDAAEVELRHLYSELSENERPGLVALAAEMNLPNLQVRLAKLPQLSMEEAAFASYPMPGDMVQASRDILDPALVLAVARHESGFRGDAESSAGAKGMMQMMPATAKSVMRQAEQDALSVADASDSIVPLAETMNDAALSAKLGATYLRMLTKEPAVGTNVMKILAGYNAGPGAVASWSKTARSMNDPLLYLESIPYPETHNYVMQVMAHYWIYQSMMGQNPASLAQLARGEWPTLQNVNG